MLLSQFIFVTGVLGQGFRVSPAVSLQDRGMNANLLYVRFSAPENNC